MLALGGAKLLQLSRLRDQLVSGAKDLPAAALRAAVASAVADSRTYTSEARTATATVQGATSEQTASVTLLAASEAARTTANGFVDDYYKRRIFDPYLKFASAHDEEEFRRREAERQAAIAEAMAEHTPEGELRALGIEREQLNDAGAHGADRSREFKSKLDVLKTRERALERALADKDHQQDNNDREAKVQPHAAPSACRVSPGVLAALREAGVTVPPQDGTGHGVAERSAAPCSGAAVRI